MPRFSDLDFAFVCPYRDGCPYLEGNSTRSVWERHCEAAGLEDQYEHQLQAAYRQIDAQAGEIKRLERDNAELRAHAQAVHQRQFKGRRHTPPPPAAPGGQRKKRGAPVGHPGWQRPKPKHIDHVIPVPAPKACPHCNGHALAPVAPVHEHVQEDIVLEPRTVVTCDRHQQAHCPRCNQTVWQPGPNELPGAYIGPAAKATAAYLRYELNVPERKISRFFADFFGLRFVPASAYGFERQLVRRGVPLYEDLRQKIRALSAVHADETSWRHDGQSYWVWYAGNDDLAFYHLDAHRSGEAAQRVLGERLRGTLVSDAYASYHAVHPQDWQSCLAHLRTTAKELEQELALLKGRATDPAARGFCQAIQGWVHDACQAHHRLAKGPWRAKRAQRQGRALRRQLAQLCQKSLRYAKAEKFRQRLRGPEQQYFFTCFRRRGVPPTNNQAERSLRPVVIMRRVVQGTRSEKGLENHSVVRSFFETARRQGKKPHEFLFTLLTKPTAEAQAALYRHPVNAKPRPPLRC